MSIQQLEYVLAIDKYRHFSKAANACFVTQPTLSMQVQKLEEELGITIFDRSKNPIIPTLEGEAVIRQAKIVLKENKKLQDVIKECKANICGNFKLGVIPTLSPYIIPLFANNFAKKYPQINLIIEECKTEDIIKLLDEDELDAGLLVTPLHIESIIERVLYYEPFYLFVSEDNQLSKKELIHESELELRDIWLLNKGNCFRDQVLNICSEKKKELELEDNLKFESGNFETLKNMVLTCSGYTILPYMAVKQLAKEHQKYVREFCNPIPTREIALVHSRHFLKERIIKALEKEIKLAIPEKLEQFANIDKEVIEIY